MPQALALTDQQLDLVHRLAWPLSPPDRSRFLEALAQALQDQELGDGVVYRIAIQTQRRFWSPPELGRGPAGVGKYGRP
jgi:hypothetical protein